MAQQISDFTAATSADKSDLLAIVDVSDTTDAATGTTKKITASEFLGYTTYIPIITQSGTSAPSQTVVQNTTGITSSWTRDSAGIYWLDFTGITGTFYSPMTSDWAGNAILINIHGYDGSAALDGGYMYYWDSAAKKLYLYCYDDTGGSAIDIGTLLGTSALHLPEIRFYI